MKRITNREAIFSIGVLALSAGFLIQWRASAQEGPSINPPKRDARPNKPPAQNMREYMETIRKTAQMVSDGQAQSIAGQHGLSILNLTWEDTGRYKNSSVGPNISDMTIQVGVEDPSARQFSVIAMPVIRFPNFSDKTCDLDPRDFTLLVGNEKGRSLKRISLYEYLANPTAYMSNPRQWLHKKKTLLAPRDSKVLVSGQACFLPVPRQGIATFNPVVFNYQSHSGDPAVLTILATREGTSMTIIDNKRDAFSVGHMWGQRLFHNERGMRASLTGQRESEFTGIKQGGDPKTRPDDPKPETGLNMVLLIQVPLKQKSPLRPAAMGGGYGAQAGAKSEYADEKARRSDVENAVIGHGELEGPFTEVDNLAIERDERFPVRVTVQFYKATSNGVVSQADIHSIKEQIERVYAMSDYVGSLVTEGRTGRVTEYDGSKVQPAGWWESFWVRYEQNTGESRHEAIAKLTKLLGKNYTRRPVCELYLRDMLRP